MYVPQPMDLTDEELRLHDGRTRVPWRSRGPYLGEHRWGTARDDGASLGASHRTGWTDLVAPPIRLFTPQAVLEPDDRPLDEAHRRVAGEPIAPVGAARGARGVSRASPRPSERSGSVHP